MKLKNIIEEQEDVIIKRHPNCYITYVIQYGKQPIVSFEGNTPHKIVKAIIKAIDNLLIGNDNITFNCDTRYDGSMVIIITISILGI